MNLYLDIVGGISGDMTLATLLGLGVDYNNFIKIMNTLSIKDDFDIMLTQVSKGAIGGNKIDVNVKNKKINTFRNLNDIIEIINKSKISLRAKYLSKKIFTTLALSESKVHLSKVEDVHFHEVGAIDSIVDIIGTAVLIDMLDIQEVYYSEIPLGNGFTNSAHGKIPLPAPATLNLLEGLNVKLVPIKAETVTPTGAAILKALDAKYLPNISMKIIATSIGCGTKDFDIPNILRGILYEQVEDYKVEKLAILSCNLDDITGEMMGHAMDEIFNNGALDVWYTPIIMKKSRPAYKLSVLTKLENKDQLTKVIFEHTTTLGIRQQIIDRTSLKRNIRYKKTKYGEIRIKDSYLGSKLINSKPEFEDLKTISKLESIPIRKIILS